MTLKNDANRMFYSKVKNFIKSTIEPYYEFLLIHHNSSPKTNTIKMSR